MARREIADVLHDPVRLGVLRDTRLLDTPPEESFDRLTRLAARILDVPATFITLVDEHRVFCKSSYGSMASLSEQRELRVETLCHHTLVSDGPVVVRDAREDPALCTVPTLRSLGVVAYAGIPLAVHGSIIGSFCAIDFAPRDWTDTQIEVLVQLAQSTVSEIELHMVLRVAEEKAAAAQAARAQFEALHEMVEHAESPPRKEDDDGPAAQRRDRVLIADDDPSIRALVHRVLSSDGYEMLEARDGDEAIAIMREGRADIVLLDLKMPTISGWEVLSARGSQEALRRVPVIVLSARRGPDVARALASGAYALLSKPFEMQALKYIVRSCLAEAREAQAVLKID